MNDTWQNLRRTQLSIFFEIENPGNCMVDFLKKLNKEGSCLYINILLIRNQLYCMYVVLIQPRKHLQMQLRNCMGEHHGVSTVYTEIMSLVYNDYFIQRCPSSHRISNRASIGSLIPILISNIDTIHSSVCTCATYLNTYKFNHKCMSKNGALHS